ncbi:MAG: hypothetical protein FJ320_07405 [SAR202 cluster bacterium]|nr:hypothetical protein [SAR202 cluster bacterium]
MAAAEEGLARYLERVRGAATPGEWWALFSDLCVALPGLERRKLPNPFSQAASPACGLCDNLVIEYRRDMHQRWGDPNAGLRLGVSEARARNPRLSLAALATNGLTFHVYTPDFDESGRVIGLHPADGLNLVSPMMTPQRSVEEMSGLLRRWLK